MRITEKNTPVLKYLKWRRPLTEHPDFGTEKLGVFVVQEADAPSAQDRRDAQILSLSFLSRWAELAGHYTQTIEVISKPFSEAMWKNAEKVYNEETVKECVGKYYRGTLIHGPVTICYDFYLNYKMQLEGNLMMHIKDNLVLLVNGDHRFVSELARNHYKAPDWDIVRNTFKEVLILNLFKRFAETETVQAKPFKKVKIAEENTLLADTDLPLNYLDCSWFRTIVRNEGFMVKGHFRLQPYKNGKRLIYIQPFQKHGYTRRAKKDSQNSETDDAQ